MVILSVGLEPRHDAKETAHLFGISCSADGWFIEKHPKLDPVSTMTEGIFIAGCVSGPKDIPASVAQGSAAAARVLAYIDRGEITLEPVRATVDQERCSGCRICNELCPYSAVEFDASRKRSRVIPAACKACGGCVPACPSGAVRARHFTSEQILAQVEGVLA